MVSSSSSFSSAASRIPSKYGEEIQSKFGSGWRKSGIAGLVARHKPAMIDPSSVRPQLGQQFGKGLLTFADDRVVDGRGLKNPFIIGGDLWSTEDDEEVGSNRLELIDDP